MEYNFLADILAKFSSLTPWIQGIIILSSATVPICFFYFLKQIIFQIVESLMLKNICNRSVEEKAKATAIIADKFISEYIPTK